MYLSRLILDPRSRAVRNDLANCQSMHRTLMRAFEIKPGKTDGVRRDLGLLYRTEIDRRSGAIKLYVQSLAPPDWSKLPQGYLADDAGVANPACKEVGPIYERLPEGAILTFGLRANPTRKVGTSLKAQRQSGVKDNGRRSFIAGADRQIEWLKRKGEAGGFALLSVKIANEMPDLDLRPEPDMHGYKGRGEERKKITFGSVFFQGRLRITDQSKFQAALANGIGPGKAYGFGLLTIAPPR